MIIELHGWCVDRELQVLSKMLEEAGLEQIQGQFIDDGFETFEEVSEEVQTAIANYFAPGKPVIRLSDQQKSDLAIAEAYERLYNDNLQNSLAIAEIYEMLMGGK